MYSVRTEMSLGQPLLGLDTDQETECPEVVEARGVLPGWQSPLYFFPDPKRSTEVLASDQRQGMIVKEPAPL